MKDFQRMSVFLRMIETRFKCFGYFFGYIQGNFFDAHARETYNAALFHQT